MTSQLVTDLLAALSTREETRRGAGCEVDKHPTPSTRGTAEGNGPRGRTQPLTVEQADVRARTRVPWTLTNGVPCCDDCRHRGQPRHYRGVRIGESVCDVDGTCWEAEQLARDVFYREHGRKPTAADARFLRGEPVEVEVDDDEVAEVIELPIAKLARGKIGHPPKMTDEQIDAALDELANEPTATITSVARREWRAWGFKNEASAKAALRRYRSLRDLAGANTDTTQEVAA